MINLSATSSCNLFLEKSKPLFVKILFSLEVSLMAQFITMS